MRFTHKSSRSVLLAGYAKHENGKEALNRFEHMQFEGVALNAVTYACRLKACGIIGAINNGNEIRTEVSQNSLWKSDLV
eukprot:c45311_g1_i1 orf=115-351(+)